MNKKTLLPLLALMGTVATLASGCVIAERDGGSRHDDQYREGYYDRDNHRYYHEHQWRDCEERDEHCR